MEGLLTPYDPGHHLRSAQSDLLVVLIIITVWDDVIGPPSGSGRHTISFKLFFRHVLRRVSGELGPDFLLSLSFTHAQRRARFSARFPQNITHFLLCVSFISILKVYFYGGNISATTSLQVVWWGWEIHENNSDSIWSALMIQFIQSMLRIHYLRWICISNEFKSTLSPPPLRIYWPSTTFDYFFTLCIFNMLCFWRIDPHEKCMLCISGWAQWLFELRDTWAEPYSMKLHWRSL